MSYLTVDPPRRHRLSVADYYRMAEVGILRPDERVELIDGEIIDMAPIGSRHNATVTRLATILHKAVGDKAIVQTRGSVSLGAYSEPEPDIAVLHPRADFYWSAHPRAAEIQLIVEVAESSLRFDRDVKLPLYARHNVGETWLVDVDSRRVIRHRKPAQGKYTWVDEPDLGSPLEIEAIDGVRVDLRELFPTGVGR
ncbi:MAG TPA: Uma2 family endonuclease [Gammaproteobacteria bacterium]|nr:Uma2 family endonuclease [Gammaproteobacteria bacterium]